MKIIFTFLLVLFITAGSYCQSSRKVLFIGVDGCRADAVLAANTPALDDFLENAVYSTQGLCDYKTWSGNGWSSMLTGVWHTKHGVTDNSFAGHDYINYPDFISRAEEYNPDLRSITAVHWGPINDTIIQYADVKNTFGTDAEVKTGAVNALINDDPDILFVAFDDVDHAGHSYGFSPDVPQYITAIEITDGYISEIITAMQNRPDYESENWLVVVTTDHGGTPAGHGGGTLQERTIFNIYSNPEFQAEELSRVIITETDTFTEARFVSETYAVPDEQQSFLFGAAQDFTIELWVKPESFIGDPSFISNKNWSSGLNPGFVISAQQGQFWKVNIGDGTNRLDIQGGYLLPGEWHHLAVSFDRDGLMTAFEDGIVVGFEKMQGIDNIDTGLPIVINQDGTTTYGYDFGGIYKDIRIWNAALADSIITQWATKEINPDHPFYDQLLANWKCNEELGTTLFDSGPENNNCTVTGAIVWTSDQANTFSSFDYSGTTREPDNAVTALTWLCVPVLPEWELDGKSRVTACEVITGQKLAEEDNFIIYPNPAADILTIDFKNTLKRNTIVRIYDYSGRMISSLDIENPDGRSTIYTGNLANGFYWLEAEDGKNKTTQKLIIN